MSAAHQLSAQQKDFFETFGYLALPGAIAEDVSWIIEEFERAWATHASGLHDGSKRTMYPSVMANATPRLQTLFEHPAVVGALDSLFGEGWSHYGGDGNFYSGDTWWHSDGACEAKTVCRHIKVAFYLDPLTRATGALRVIPGSHHFGDAYMRMLTDRHYGGVPGDQVPSAALETVPGDLVLFDHRIQHASFGGSQRRRMFTLNTFAPCPSERERDGALAIMRSYRDNEKVDWRYWTDLFPTYSPARQKYFAKMVEIAHQVVTEAAVPV